MAHHMTPLSLVSECRDAVGGSTMGEVFLDLVMKIDYYELIRMPMIVRHGASSCD